MRPSPGADKRNAWFLPGKFRILPGLQASAARPSPRNQQVAELERRNLPFGIAYDNLARLLLSALPAN